MSLERKMVGGRRGGLLLGRERGRLTCRLLDGLGRVVGVGEGRVMMPFLEEFEIIDYQLEQVWIEF
jgi:hypothetical protein